MDVNKILWVAIVLSIVTFQFWHYLPKETFFIGMALFIFLISIIIFKQNKELFVSFLLLCLSLNNLLDELFFNPKNNGINEFIFLILTPIIYYARKNNNRRTLYCFIKNNFPSFYSRRRKISDRIKKK